jgi:hypothetical protein
VNLSVSGPILEKQKLGFFFSLYSMDRSQARPVLAMLPDGLLQSDALANSDRLSLNTRLDGRISPSQSWSWQVGYRGGRRLNEGIGGFNLPERASDSADKEIESALSWTSILSASAVNQLRAYYEWDSDASTPLNQTPAILVNGAFSAGGAQDLSFTREHEIGLENVYALTRGKHSVRLGGGGRTELQNSDNRSNFEGSFEFASLDDYLIQRPLFFRRNEGNPYVAFTQSQFFGFVQEEWRPLPQLNVSLGLRYEAQTGVRDYNNFGPRLGLAWSPGKSRKTVLRSGFGIFFERRSSSLYEQSLQFDGRRIRSVIVTDPGFPDPLATSGVAIVLPPSIVSLDPDLRAPYAMLGGVALERQLAGKTLMVVEYRVQRGVALFRSRNLNAPIAGPGLRPRAEVGNLNQFESSASSFEQAISVTVRGRWKAGDFSTQYRYQRAFSDTEEADFLPANNFDLRPEWGRSDNDRRHRFRLSGTFQLPHGFRSGLMASLSTGAPFDIITGSDDNQDTVINDRPSGLSRNSGEGPGFASVDIRLGREWVLHEVRGRKIIFEAAGEVFNLFNHTNFVGFVGNLRSPFFGRATSARDPRQVQVSVKVSF